MFTSLLNAISQKNKTVKKEIINIGELKNVKNVFHFSKNNARPPASDV